MVTPRSTISCNLSSIFFWIFGYLLVDVMDRLDVGVYLYFIVYWLVTSGVNELGKTFIMDIMSFSASLVTCVLVIGCFMMGLCC